MKTKQIVKLIVIAVVASVLIVAGYFAYPPVKKQITKNSQANAPVVEVYYSKEECEQKTGKDCLFQACDYIPKGKTVDETCGLNFKKGWVAQ